MTEQTNSPTQPTRKRRRPAVVCAECRRRKIACDRKSPCGQCALHNVECIYVTGSVAPAYGRPLRPQPASSRHNSLNSGDGASKAGTTTNTVDGTSQDTNVATSSGSPLDEDDEVDPTADPSLGNTISLGERSSRFGGRLAKTRLFGRSHWMNNMDEFKDVHSLTHLVHFVSGSLIYKSMRTSKRIARIIKAEEMRRVATLPETTDTTPNDTHKTDIETWFKVPPRAVADRLVDLYFNVFEPQFRILHIPTFRREYETYMDSLENRAGQAQTKTKDTTQTQTKQTEKQAKESKASATAHQVFIVKLVLVLALGSCFYDDTENPAAAATLHDELRIAAARTVTQQKNNADFAYCVPLDKHRLNLDTLQIYCLVTVARQTAALALGDDLTWFTTGGLLHTVFGMGLNRDPSHFKSLSFAQAEMRRRLWATILELVVQSSLDQGMPPLISIDDYDCAPPLNLNDDEFGMEEPDGPSCNSSQSRQTDKPANPMNVHIPIHYHPKETGDDETRFYPGAAPSARGSSVPKAPAHNPSTNSVGSKGHPDTVFTQTSMQRLLYRSLPTRLKIVKALNGLGASLTYERALQLSQELLETCRYTAPTLRAAPLNSSISGSIPEAERAAFAKLRIAFYEMLTRRFHHSLHSPFARKAGNNVQFYFSRRARVETVLRLLSFFKPASASANGSPGVLVDFNTPIPSDAPASELTHASGIPFSLIQPTAAQDPCRRLWLIGRGLLKCTMVDIKATAVIEMIHQLQEDHFVPGADLTLSQRELYDTVRTIIDLSHARIEAGETNVKGYLFFRGALAQVDALMTGKPVRQTIVDAAQTASEKTISTLKGVAARRGIALPDDIDEEDEQGRAVLNGGSGATDPPTISPVVLQADELVTTTAGGAQNVHATQDVGMSGMAPRLPTGSSFNSLAGGGNEISTPSQILGMVDVDSAVHLSSAATTELSSASGVESGLCMGMSMDMNIAMPIGHMGHMPIGSMPVGLEHQNNDGNQPGNAENAQGWVDDWIMDPQSEFGLDNWFFPYNDRINGN